MKERRRGRDSIRIYTHFSEGSLNYDKVFYVKVYSIRKNTVLGTLLRDHCTTTS